MGWPNVVSATRILLAPVLVVLVVVRERPASFVAAAVFVIGAATDRLDGYLARRYHSHSRTGAWLDPLADKLFTLAPVVTLTVLGAFPVWAAVVFVVREVAVSVLRARRGARGRSMPASPLGKWKTAFQMLAILLYLLPLDPSVERLRLGSLLVAVGLTVWSGVDYFVRAEAR
jgi:CDP-diacylglycerol--glycerol-3-phosphate 3-phosphatidyltransferase